MRRVLLIGMAALLIDAASAIAQQTVFVVRHAERADAAPGAALAMASDPDLSETGKARAQSLAAALEDAKIVAIYATEYKRTQQTAQPLATLLGVAVSVVPAKDVPALIQKVKGSTGNVLVVGHSNTVGLVIAALMQCATCDAQGAEGKNLTEPVKVSDSDYDNLFIVVRGEKPSLVRLHFR